MWSLNHPWTQRNSEHIENLEQEGEGAQGMLTTVNGTGKGSWGRRREGLTSWAATATAAATAPALYSRVSSTQRHKPYGQSPWGLIL